MISDDIEIRSRREFELAAEERKDLLALLALCFDGMFTERIFFKQLPHWRYLAYRDGKLVGHLGIDHRVVRVGSEIVPVFGLIDLCIHPTARGTGLGCRLVDTVVQLGQAHNVPFALAIAADQRFYKKCGFQELAVNCRWLAVDDVISLSVIEENMAECFVMRSLTGRSWPEGPVDLVGYLF